MQSGPIGQLPSPVILTGQTPGYAIIPSPTPLTFLNYYDGKFLRASDLRQEQLGMQNMIELSNQAAGTPGAVYGFDVRPGSGDTLTLGPGLGIDPKGRVLYLPQSADVAISDLLASMQGTSRSPGGTPPPASANAGSESPAGFQPCDLVVPVRSTEPVPSADLFLVTLSAAEGLCGTDEVFGRLCDAACTTAADRPWRVEGVLLGLVPLTLGQLVTSSSVLLTGTHLRSRVASAYYAAEAAAGGSLISAAGLATDTWCLGATAVTGDAIFLGVLARSGGCTLFLDEWTARRERIETSPQRYWAGRMAMRPWNVFLAQVLQFQCQLAELGERIATGGGDPCDRATTLLGRSAELISKLREAGPTPAPGPGSGTTAAATSAGLAGAPPGSPPAGEVLDQTIADYRQEVADVLAGRAFRSAHLLVDGGIVELPPAGYLPVDLTLRTPLEAQVYQLLGLGVELRFCVMRHDEAGFQFTRAQHLDRISLLTGLDDPKKRQQVDIFVPDGTRQDSSSEGAPTGIVSEAVTTSVAVYQDGPSIEPVLDWVLFRRRSDVDCGAPAQQADVVTLWVTTANTTAAEALAQYWALLVEGNAGERLNWYNLGELQFKAGESALVTPAETVRSWWTSKNAGHVIYGAAYAPAASADPVPIDRAQSLVGALAPAASGVTVQYAALATPPGSYPLMNGTVGALFVLTAHQEQYVPQ
jgi:hypothetical protein